jgi:hypothetical protein
MPADHPVLPGALSPPQKAARTRRKRGGEFERVAAGIGEYYARRYQHHHGEQPLVEPPDEALRRLLSHVIRRGGEGAVARWLPSKPSVREAGLFICRVLDHHLARKADIGGVPMDLATICLVRAGRTQKGKRTFAHFWRLAEDLRKDEKLGRANGTPDASDGPPVELTQEIKRAQLLNGTDEERVKREASARIVARFGDVALPLLDAAHLPRPTPDELAGYEHLRSP